MTDFKLTLCGSAKLFMVVLANVICNLSFVIFAAPQLNEGKLEFRHYGQEQGLPSNCVRDIAQDSRGFIWLATDGGLARFDGRDFRHYHLHCNPPVHDDNYTSAILALNDDMWVGTDAHLFRYVQEADTFEYVGITDEKGQPASIMIRNITNDRDGYIWINALGQGVIKLDQSKESPMAKFYKFPKHKNVIAWVYVDSRNDVWATSGQNVGGIYKYDKSKDDFKPFVVVQNKVPISTFGSVLTEDEEHNLWMGQKDGSLICIDPFSGEVRRIVNRDNQLGIHHIHTLKPIGNGMMLIGSDAGLAVYDRHSDKMRLYKQDELDIASLSDQFVYPIIQDTEGGVWIGTFYGGLNYLIPKLKSFEKYRPSRYANSVSGSVISGFAEDAKGNIYIASDDGGLSKFTPSTNTFKSYQLNGNVPENLHALMVDGTDLWIGTYGQEVFVMDLITEKVRSEQGKTKDGSSYAMLRDSHGRLWIASGSWLQLYCKETREYEPIRDLNALIVDIDEDKQGCLWISTQGYGIYRYNPANGDWRNFRYSTKDGSLPHNHVSCIVVDSDNRKWIGTAAGLARYDAEADCFVLEPKLKTLGAVMGMVEDQNTLWISTDVGLAKYRPESESLEVVTMADGLASDQFLINAMLKASNGRIYTGTRNGFNAFFPYQIRPNEFKPHVYITGLEINNNEITAGDEHLPGDINHLKELKLHPDDHSLALSFASLSFVNPNKNQYEYRMDGFDKDWVKAGNQNKAYYTNLPAGTYTFRVRGSNSDNLWSDDEARLQIKVLPPWYASWWMKVIYILLIAALIFGIGYLIMQRSNQKHKSELRRISNEKEIEVYQAKLSFFTMVAHEIRTPVSLIIGPLEKLLKRQNEIPQSATKDLTIIEKNSQRLLFLVNQLLDFKKVEEAQLTVRFKKSNLTNLVHGVTDRFGPSMEQKGITLDVRCEVPADFTADVDYELVTKLVSNLMNNARKFTKDHVECILKADEGRGKFSITVRDNGIGVSKKNQEKIFRPFYQVHEENQESKGGTGLGLSIVQNVVEAHGGTIAIDSELGRGTAFIATFPIHQAEVEEDMPEEKDVKKEEEVVLAPTDRKVKMLVVDDNEELCNFIANSFDEQYEVITAEDGEEAMRLLQKNPDVAIIISDWMMPKKDGVELCREVRADKMCSHIPFVLLTAKTDNMSKIEGLNCGADSFIEKPFSVQVLQARIENLMHMREMLQKKYSQTPLEPIESVAPHALDNELLTELTRHIEENFSNPELDVDFLASKMDMSRSSLYGKIRSLVDVTPNDLIRITRLKNAAKLLAEGKYRINEVCYMVGFNSPSYFAKCFLKQFGVSPSDFANKH